MMVMTLIETIPAFVWDGIFLNLNWLVPTLILTMFNANYQNRRKKEFQIMGDIASLRIEAYEKLLSLLSEVAILKTPSLEELRHAKDIFQHFGFRTFNYDYPHMFDSEKSFDDFYARLIQLSYEQKIYLDYQVNHMLEKSIAIFSHYKNCLDAFCDTEQQEFCFTEAQIKHHIDRAYQLAGMAMISDCTRAYIQLDKTIAHQLNHFRIHYKSHHIVKSYRWVRDAILWRIMKFNRRHFKAGTMFSSLLSCLSKENVLLMNDLIEFTDVLMYVHFSDNYNPVNYFKEGRIPSEQEIISFRAAYYGQMHYI